ncbi:MAG TPA: ABC transporter permease [Epulopiscium sp.]|nr:ABC transporter permease [Candidatus Epulonipiscium sp.]
MRKKIAINITANLIRLMTLLVGVSMIAFTLISVSPVDPVQAYVGAGVAVSPEQRENIGAFWGLNDSPTEQFVSWSKAILKGDFGQSLIYRKPVISVIGERFKSSVVLMGMAWILAGIIGFFLGIIMGVWKGRWPDKIIKTICLVLSSTPTFWIGLLFLMIFSIELGWFPIGLSVPAGMLNSEVTMLDRIYHMILPAITLSLTSFATVALHTREKTIKVLSSDYVLFAKARGEKEISIIKNHGIRNIIVPAVTLQFASLSELFGGSILVEQVFSYPGLGQAAVQAGLRSDVPLLLGVTIFSALFVFVGNSIANIIYNLVDPKMRENSLK